MFWRKADGRMLAYPLMHGVQVNIWKLCKITMQGQILLLYLFICYVVLLSFFVVKPVKSINMKSNVNNTLIGFGPKQAITTQSEMNSLHA
jgi:uncharacterized protein (UPF0333 family)